MKRAVLTGVAVVAWAGLVSLRLVPELRHAKRGGAEKDLIGSTWDPRGFEAIDRITRQRESDSFRGRLRSGASSSFRWPGLASAEVSWTWLDLLQGLHNPASYEGDFSWVFSKLDTVIQNSPPKERYFVTTLAPFFYVIGHDYIGANILMQEMIKRAPDAYNVWFWSGFHAAENLKDRKLAADLFLHAARMPFAPDYLAALAARLIAGGEFVNSEERQALIEKNIEPALIEKIKRARPEWFKQN